MRSLAFFVGAKCPRKRIKMPKLFETPETPEGAEQDTQTQTPDTEAPEVTSIRDITTFKAKHHFIENMDIIAQINALPNPADLSKEDREAFLNRGVSLLSRYHSQVDKAECQISAVFAEHAIRLGKILNKLKVAVKSIGKHNWMVWAEENVKGIGKSSREDYMRLASTPDAEQFVALGKDRLIRLVRAAGKNKPIADFLEKYDITFAQESEESLPEMKVKVDTALNLHCLSGLDLEADEDKVQQLSRAGIKVTSRLKEAARNEGEDGRTVDDLIDHLLTNNGHLPPKEEGTPQKGFQDIGGEMIQFLTIAMKDEDIQRGVDLALLEKIETEIAALKRLLMSMGQ